MCRGKAEVQPAVEDQEAAHPVCVLLALETGLCQGELIQCLFHLPKSIFEGIILLANCAISQVHLLRRQSPQDDAAQFIGPGNKYRAITDGGGVSLSGARKGAGGLVHSSLPAGTLP